ncbi:MAG: hypothetical protein ACYTF6_13865 [Planctomycetota bacterium]|jgi:hypothetical protein
MRNEISSFWLGAILSLICAAGCVDNSEDMLPAGYDAYLNRIAALAEYETGLPSGQATAPEARREQAEIKAIFENHRADILRPFLPFLRNFDGGEYAHLKVIASGAPSEEHEEQIVFRVNIRGASTADRLSGFCTAYGCDGFVFWDRKQSDVKRWELWGCGGCDIPPAATEKAIAIAGAHDQRYTKQRLATRPDCARWLPATYVDQIVFAPRGKPKYEGGPTPPLNVAEEYKAIKENTGHNLIMLKYVLGRPEGSTVRYEQLRHYVFVDIEFGRVVGVNERTVHVGPDI